MSIYLRIFRIMLPLLVLLLGSTAAQAQTEEEGVVYTLTTRCVPADAASTYPASSTYEEGASVNVYFSRNSGFKFLQWEDEAGNVVSTSGNFYYTMPAQNVTLIARFEYNPDSPEEPTVPEIKTYATIHYEVTPSDGGYIRKYGEYQEVGSSDVKYEVGTTARLSAYSNSGFRFVNWTENGVEISTSSSLSFTVEESGRSVVANFTYDPSNPDEPGEPIFDRKLTLKSNPEGAGTSFSGEGVHQNNQNVTVSCAPTDYYIFDNWTDDLGNVVSDQSRFTYTMPNRHVTLTANFHYDFNPANPDEPDSPSIDDQGIVGKPRMTMKDDTHVLILCTTPGATIYYTLDGSEPTTASSVYTEAVFVPGNIIVKAIAVKEGMTDSAVTTYQVKSYHAEMPVIAFENGKIVMRTATPDATIYYTLDNSDPTSASTAYVAPIDPAEDVLVKAIACKDELTDSDIAVYIFTREEHLMEAPAIEIDADGKLVITPSVAGGTTRYTMDGTDPTATSTLYEGPVTLTGNCTVKAYTSHINYYDSPIAELEVEGFTVETPTYVYANRALTLSIATEGAEIRYTLDGTVPTETSTLYTAPLELTEDCQVVARGFKANHEPSATVSYTFVLADHQVAIPAFAYDSNTATLTLTCETEGAEIRYTTDGSDPTATTGIKYESPIVLDGNATYKARAFRSDLLDSKVVSLLINDQAVPTPTATFANKQLTLACQDEAASIRYTTDGSNPTSASTLYSAPVALTQDCTVKFIAQRDGYNDSEVGAFEFKVADYQVATPLFSYNTESGNVTITCATEGAEIRYTMDGSEPTATTGTVYAAAIPVEGNFTLKAKAFRSDLFDSATGTLEATDNQVPAPTATFANKVLTLACADTQATIYYTLDGTDPTAASAVYSAPLELTQNCNVKFVAIREHYLDSEIGNFQFQIANYQVATPVMTYNPVDLSLTISCATENAEIRYTSDGSEPTATTGTKYEGPITFYGNFTFNARGFRSDLFDSETASLAISGQKVYTPTATFANKQLTLACADSLARIVYTLDGTAPTEASTAYTGPISLTEDCTVNFIAVREGFNNSDAGTFEFKKADYQVAAPVVSHSIETLQATMTCATEGATIRYTTDGTEPTATTGTLYTGPIDLTGNVTFTAKGFHDALYDSETTVYEVQNMKLPTPTAAYGAHTVILTCEDPTAEIRYTTDGTDPTPASTLYTAPIQISGDCTVRFIAAKEQYVSSDEGSYQFVLADWQEAMPTITKDFTGRKLTISQANSLPVSVNIDGTAQTYSTPATIDVAPGMASVTATAVAQDADRYDSQATTDAIVFHKAPVLSYDGHTLSVSPASDDPAPANAQRRLSINGELKTASEAADIKEVMSDFCSVAASIQSGEAFASEPTEMSIDLFNTGRVAGVRNGHRLDECLGTWGDSKDSYTYLRVKGEINEADIKSIADLPELTTLHIDANIAEGDYSEALAGTRIETIYSNSFPKGMTSDMPRLTTLIWGKTGEKMAEGTVEETGNPNLLVWVENAEDAPADAANVVTYTAAGEGSATDPAGSGVEGHAASITLKPGFPFNAHMALHAEYIEAVKNFSLPTEVGVSAGWETLVLPFTPDTIRHESAGYIVPFSVWNEENHDGPKPYWLYRANNGDWEETSGIQAGVPYIISMPNSSNYVDGFNLAGNVKFIAGGGGMLGPSTMTPAITDWKDGATFEGTFMPVEEEGILSLNVNATEEGVYRGSAFVADDITLPFGAFVRAPGAPQAIPVFGDGNGIKLPTITADGIRVESPAPGVLRVSSSRELHTAIYTPEGAAVRKLDLKAGETVTVEGLTRGLYICGGVKVMVR